MKQTSVETIEICHSCSGKGKVPRPPAHLADESFVLITCETCLGSGRLRVETITKTSAFVGD